MAGENEYRSFPQEGSHERKKSPPEEFFRAERENTALLVMLESKRMDLVAERAALDSERADADKEKEQFLADLEEQKRQYLEKHELKVLSIENDQNQIDTRLSGFQERIASIRLLSAQIGELSLQMVDMLDDPEEDAQITPELLTAIEDQAERTDHSGKMPQREDTQAETADVIPLKPAAPTDSVIDFLSRRRGGMPKTGSR